jgi:hypothetical protein
MFRFGLILLLMCLTVSCKKKPRERFIPADMKAYWDFRPGSYWIYKDSVSGAIDSVYVTNRVNNTGDGILNYNKENIIYEYLQVDMHSSLDGYDYQYWINTQAGGKGYDDYNVVYATKAKPGDFVDTHNNFVYPLIIGNHTYNFYGTSETDTCIINSLYNNYLGYNDVVEMINTLNSFEHYKHTKSFYAKNIGLVRYEVPDSNKYRQLIDYYIVQ